MREILFKGKRVDNGEWIEGFFAKSGDKTFILIDNDIAVGYVAMKEVLPETVGQYTGLTDKNGKKIFEGDIIEQIRGKDAYGKNLFVRFCINFSEDYLSYQAFANGLKGYSYAGISFAKFCWKNVNNKVIGNIHDNPELLKKE